jgi:pyruvate,orthophosphate dikinase
VIFILKTFLFRGTMGTKALEANLQRTAVEVVIPEEHGLLLEITSAYRGVHQQTEDLLREVHHQYVGWAQTLDDLHRRATGDFYYYDVHEHGPDGLALLSSFYEKVAKQADSYAVRDKAVRLWLRFLEKLASGSERNVAVLLESLSRIEALFDAEPERSADATPGLKRLLCLLESGDGSVHPAAEHSARTFARTVTELYEAWLSREDPLEWWHEDVGTGAGAVGIPPQLEMITHAALKSHLACIRELRALEAMAPRLDRVLELPDQGQIFRAYLETAAARGSVTDGMTEVRWLTRLLGSEALTPVHESALRRLARLCSNALGTQDAAEQQAFIRGTMSLLRRTSSQHDSSSLELVRRIGLQVLEHGASETAELFVAEALEQGFHYPRFEGYTDSWSIRVNPTHKQNIRAHLDLIGANPSAARALLATLTTRLKVGGVFLADTDLIQRDVSAFLARDIAPVYHHAKQLLRLLPVYFSDIGAEGELRRVSTRLDEIQGRSDALCHFLRKQSHVESNPLLSRMVEQTAHYWATGDPSGLRDYLPASVYQTLGPGARVQPGLSDIFSSLLEQAGSVEQLFGLGLDEVRSKIAAVRHADPSEAEKAELLFRFHRELERKYGLDHRDLLERLAAYAPVPPAELRALADALEAGRESEALDRLLDVLETLQRVILSVGTYEALEDIYHKRHIAVGIPSMYGSYREERLEALGLTYRIESLAVALLARRIQSLRLDRHLLDDLPDVSRCLGQLRRAMSIDGMRTARIDTALSMLTESLRRGVGCDCQYLDIFQLLSRGVEEAVQTYFIDFYGEHLDRLFEEMTDAGVLSRAKGTLPGPGIATSEALLRSLIGESFGLQLLDNLCSRIVRTLHTFDFPATACGNQRRKNGPRRWAVPLEAGGEGGVILLGNKGANLQRLVAHGFPVPPGFVITTDLFTLNQTVRSGGTWGHDFVEMIRAELRRLEAQTGTRLGDPDRPLLLSVRGGAPISMPGMLDSLLNVGINPMLAHNIAESRGRPWTAWDSYRRFMQLWGMSHGIERDLFDQLIHRAKAECGVAKKALLPAARMRSLAMEYRHLLLDCAVPILDDPFEQLLLSIILVLQSWDSDKARLYRRELHIAEEWGTAVVIQSMVFGNLDDHSGTGVVRTRDSIHEPGTIRLFGDFIVQGQGDDVVSGLVETLPITERQRLTQAKYAGRSLEKDFPDIYRTLLDQATRMVRELDLPQQEIEFTFEAGDMDSLWLLQTRDAVLSHSRLIPTFAPGPALDDAHVATGIGASGGALSGRVARTQEEIDGLRRRHPGEPIILIRPDTVPEDIHLVLQTDGLLTSVGGATSHAAVVAKRLAKTCVVGCSELDVYDDEAGAALTGHALAVGDMVSINGMDGFVYLGSHRTTLARVEALT